MHNITGLTFTLGFGVAGFHYVRMGGRVSIQRMKISILQLCDAAKVSFLLFYVTSCSGSTGRCRNCMHVMVRSACMMYVARLTADIKLRFFALDGRTLNAAMDVLW